MLANFSFGGAAHAHVAAADRRREKEEQRGIDRGDREGDSQRDRQSEQRRV